jgi:Ca2+-binding RTX toxin-like protein
MISSLVRFGGDPDGRTNAGESYVVFGGSSLPQSIELAALDGDIGTLLKGGNSNDQLGRSVAFAGDFNADGLSDILLGALYASGAAGKTYIVYGASTLPAAIDLGSVSGGNGIVLNGIDAADLSGISVSSAGDVNGDGFGDVIIGAVYADPDGRDRAGESYVVYGAATPASSIDLDTLDGSNGLKISGIDSGDFSGESVSSAGDFNGDGFDDLIISARMANGSSGEFYVLYGSGSLPNAINLSDIDGGTGFRIFGVDPGDYFFSVDMAAAGDVNGDGFDDFLIGAPGASSNGRGGNGESYLVYGSGAPQGVLNLSELNGSNGLVFLGLDSGDLSGASVSSAGDINGDGYSDILIGAPDADPNGQVNSGESYLIYGGAANLAALDAEDGTVDGMIQLSNLGAYNGSPTPPLVQQDYALTPRQSLSQEGSTLTFDIARPDSGTSETLYFSTLSATASFDEGDYAFSGGARPVNIPVTFATGQSTATITLDILQDGTVDDGERFRAIVQADPADPATTYLARSPYVTISETPISTTDAVREGTDTAAGLTAAAWTSGRIDPEPIAGDGVASDGVAGFIDRDWYAVTLDAGSLYEFEARSLSLSTGMVALRLYDASGTAVESTFIEGASPSFQIDTAGQASASVTYYLAVSAGDTNNDDFRLATGDYDVRYTPLIAEAGPSDTVREGMDTSASLVEGQWRSGTIDAEPQSGDGVEPDGLGGFVDKDWYAVNLTEGRVYTFEADGSGVSTGQVTITLYDAAGRPLPGATATGAEPQLEFETGGLSAAATLYVGIEAADAGNGARLGATGDFKVRMSDSGPSGDGIGSTGGFTDDIIVKLAALADAAYEESTDAAQRQGFQPIDPGIAGLEDSFVSINVIEGVLENNLHFYEADVDGERSLFFAFSGTQSPIDLALQAGSWDTLYDAQAGVIDAVLTWANGAATRGEEVFQNLFVTGHSLGGILVEEYFASSQFSSSSLAQGAYGVTFGSPGSPRDAIDDSRLINFVNIADPVAALHSDDLFGFIFDESEKPDLARLSTEVLLASLSAPKEIAKNLAIELVGQPLSREGNTVVMADTENTVFGLNPIEVTHSRPVYNSNVEKLTDFYRAESRSAAEELSFWLEQDGIYALKVWDNYEFAFIVAQTFTTEFIDTFFADFKTVRVVIGLSEAAFGAVETLGSAAISFGSFLKDEISARVNSSWDYIEGRAEALNEFTISQSQNLQVLFSDLAQRAENVLFREGSAIIELDVNGDGVIDYTTRIEGTYNLDDFLWHTGPEGTVFLYSMEPKLDATSNGDQLVGDANANTIDGLGGNDLMFGRAGVDFLYGGFGEDALYGGADTDALFGSEDDDELYGEDGDDGLDGGLGNDTLDGGAGVDWLFGRENADVLRGGSETDALFGGAGDDLLQGDGGDDGLDGGTGSDTLEGGAGVDWLYGGDNGDVLRGGTETDALFGEAGNDALDGGAGDDGLDGGAGNDTLEGGEGVDWLYGSFNNDVLYGASAAVDSDDTDALFGQEGNDTLYGGGGGDNLDGGAGDDELNGGAGNDWMFGQGENDVLNGGGGLDVLFGNEGNDTLNGGADGDALDGGAGLDVLAGGAGVDVLFGGADADDFLFRATDEGEDLIRDFVTGEDRIVLDAAAFGIATGTLAGQGIWQTGAGLPADFGTGGPVLYFDTVFNALFYDTDGGTSGNATALFALETGTLTEGDIWGA